MHPIKQLERMIYPLKYQNVNINHNAGDVVCHINILDEDGSNVQVHKNFECGSFGYSRSSIEHEHTTTLNKSSS